MSTKSDFKKFVRKLGSDYANPQTVRLGRLDGVTVETGTPGTLWARQWNGKEIKVINRALVPSTFDLRVRVGIQREQPNRWIILQVENDYLTPAASGQIAFHHTQHEFGQSDEVQVERRQVIAYTIRATNPSTFNVTVYGGYFPSSSGFGYTAPSTTVDLSGYTVDTGHTNEGGAYYVGIEVDDSGTLSVNDTGTNFWDPTLGGATYIPVPDPGKYHVGYVLMYEGQTSIIDDNIRVPMPLGVIAKTTGFQIHEAATGTLADAYEFPFYDTVAALIKKITWANIKATLQTAFDTVYAAFTHTHAAADVPGIVSLSVSNISNPPTEAELITAIGAPDTGKINSIYHIDDNGGGLRHYLAMADGNHWWITTLAKAVIASISVTVNSTTSVSPSSSLWYGRASLEQLPTGVWVLCYYKATGHSTNDGALHIRFSDDYGVTWSAEDKYTDGSSITNFPMNPTVSAGQDAGEPWLIQAPNGDLLLHMWRVDYGVSAGGTYQSRSTDGGLTWSTPAAIDFLSNSNDSLIFMTDDHFIFDDVIYAGARQYQTTALSTCKNLFVKSTDNGVSWTWVTDITSFSDNTEEVGLEYIGGTTIIAILRDMAYLKTFKAVSTDMGVTWGAKTDITTAFGDTGGRIRMKTRSHWKGFDNWWLDKFIIAVGFEFTSPGSGFGRRNAVWYSTDQGNTWSGPQYLDSGANDGGYGDLLYNPTLGQWVNITYKGTTSDADLLQYNFTLSGM
jgi:hypothetical protein